jgi:hypothetical protein
LIRNPNSFIPAGGYSGDNGRNFSFGYLSLCLIARRIATLVLPADPLRAVFVRWLFLSQLIANDALILFFASIRVFAFLRHLPSLQRSGSLNRLGQALFRAEDEGT